MPRKKHSSEQIITKLREAEVAMSTGSKVSEVCRQIGVTEQTFYRWRNEYGGLRIDQVASQTTRVGERPPQESCCRPDPGQPDTEGGGGGKLLSPTRRCQGVDHAVEVLGVSERRACKVLGQSVHPAVWTRSLR